MSSAFFLTALSATPIQFTPQLRLPGRGPREVQGPSHGGRACQPPGGWQLEVGTGHIKQLTSASPISPVIPQLARHIPLPTPGHLTHLATSSPSAIPAAALRYDGILVRVLRLIPEIKKSHPTISLNRKELPRPLPGHCTCQGVCQCTD